MKATSISLASAIIVSQSLVSGHCPHFPALLICSFLKTQSHPHTFYETMSSRFVSGGTIRAANTDETRGEQQATTAAPSAEEPLPPATAATSSSSGKATEWEIVERELAAERQRREEQRRKAATGEEKSLYEILQDNKGERPPLSSLSSPHFSSCFFWYLLFKSSCVLAC